jgi:hypothetical protein
VYKKGGCFGFFIFSLGGLGGFITGTSLLFSIRTVGLRKAVYRLAPFTSAKDSGSENTSAWFSRYPHTMSPSSDTLFTLLGEPL